MDTFGMDAIDNNEHVAVGVIKNGGRNLSGELLPEMNMETLYMQHLCKEPTYLVIS